MNKKNYIKSLSHSAAQELRAILNREDVARYIKILLTEQAQLTKEETIKKCIEYLKKSKIWGVNVGLIDNIRIGELYAEYIAIECVLNELLNQPNQ